MHNFIRLKRLQYCERPEPPVAGSELTSNCYANTSSRTYELYRQRSTDNVFLEDGVLSPC